MTEISQRQLRNDSADILRRAEAGETFTVTRHGRPVGRLTGLTGSSDTDEGDPFVALSDLAASATRLPNIDSAAFRRDLDALVDSQVDI